MSVTLDRWYSEWKDVTELQAGYEVVFAAKHRDTGAYVSLVPVEAGSTGALDAMETRGIEYRMVVRPRQGAPALSEHTTTHASACKSRAIELTHEWLSKHSDGLEGEVSEA